METKKAMKHIMLEGNKTQSELGKELGISQAAVGSRLNGGMGQIKKLSEMLDKLGYKIEFVPKEAEVPYKGYTVED